MRNREIKQKYYDTFLSTRTIIVLLMDAIYKKFFERGITNSVVFNINVIALLNKIIMYNNGLFHDDHTYHRLITKLSVRDIYNEIEASDDLMWYENNPSLDYIAVQPESPEEEFDKDIMSKAASKELQFFVAVYRSAIRFMINKSIQCLEYKDKTETVYDHNGDPIPGVTRFVYASDNLIIG